MCKHSRDVILMKVAYMYMYTLEYTLERGGVMGGSEEVNGWSGRSEGREWKEGGRGSATSCSRGYMYDWLTSL